VKLVSVINDDDEVGFRIRYHAEKKNEVSDPAIVEMAEV
jgi:hypothetical protein